MSTIQAALTTALRVPPCIERVWNALKDKPHSTTKQIATRLNMAENRSAAAMTELKQRGMVKWRATPLRMPNGSIRQVKEWWCVYDKYERLSIARKPAKVNVVEEYQKTHPLVPKAVATSVTPPVQPAAHTVKLEPTSSNPPKTNEPTPKTVLGPDGVKAWLDQQHLHTALFMYKHLHGIFNYDRVDHK